MRNHRARRRVLLGRDRHPPAAAITDQVGYDMTNAAAKPARESKTVDTGLELPDRKKLAELLEKALANTYVLYAKIQGVHWNVSGPSFFSIHKMTEEQYEDLATSIDELAERIRAIGFLAPTTLARVLEVSEVKEMGHESDAGVMVEALVRDHQKVARILREAVGEADKVDDVFTADMLTARIGSHEKFGWMLRALVSGAAPVHSTQSSPNSKAA
jgi:starvation-inducible DNA-binding protein